VGGKEAARHLETTFSTKIIGPRLPVVTDWTKEERKEKPRPGKGLRSSFRSKGGGNIRKEKKNLSRRHLNQNGTRYHEFATRNVGEGKSFNTGPGRVSAYSGTGKKQVK